MTEVERDTHLELLFDSAIGVRTLPYSQFRVGDSGGRTKFSGDRSGSRYPISGSPMRPCGQVLAEFYPDVVIYSRALKDLLPRPLSRVLKKS